MAVASLQGLYTVHPNKKQQFHASVQLSFVNLCPAVAGHLKQDLWKSLWSIVFIYVAAYLKGHEVILIVFFGAL